MSQPLHRGSGPFQPGRQVAAPLAAQPADTHARDLMLCLLQGVIDNPNCRAVVSSHQGLGLLSPRRPLAPAASPALMSGAAASASCAANNMASFLTLTSATRIKPLSAQRGGMLDQLSLGS